MLLSTASVSHRMMLLAKSSPLGGDESAVRAGTKSKGNGPMIDTKLIVQYVMPLSTRFRMVIEALGCESMILHELV